MGAEGPSSLEPGRRDRTPSDKASLDLGRHRTLICLTRRDVLEQIVERSDTPGEEGWTSSNEISLDALDVRAIRNDQPRVTVEHLDIALEKQGNLAGVRRPDDERKAHGSIVVSALSPLSYALRSARAKSD